MLFRSGGGALVASSKELKDKAIFFATQSRDQAPHYQHSEIGYNYRLSNICAGIGRGQMEILDQHVLLRRSMHDFYVAYFRDIDGVTVLEEPNSDYYSNHWLSAILVDSSDRRARNQHYAGIRRVCLPTDLGRTPCNPNQSPCALVLRSRASSSQTLPGVQTSRAFLTSLSHIILAQVEPNSVTNL